jgi:hypothetical protein
MNAVGRPVEFDAARKNMLCALIRTGCTRRRAANIAGVAESTVRSALQSDPDFAARMADATAAAEVECLQTIRAAAARSWRAAAWMLQRICPREYGPKHPSPPPPIPMREVFEELLHLHEG